MLSFLGSSWLIEGEDPGPSRDIECSTSLFPDIEPLRCMHGYTCKIQIEEDKVNQIPNSGICVKSNSKGIKVISSVCYCH